jgi:hypothetical protein
VSIREHTSAYVSIRAEWYFGRAHGGCAWEELTCFTRYTSTKVQILASAELTVIHHELSISSTKVQILASEELTVICHAALQSEGYFSI